MLKLKLLPSNKFFLLKSFLSTVSIFVLFVSPPAFAQQAQAQKIYEQAVAAFERGDYQSAIDGYNQLILDVPRFSMAYMGMALALKGSGAEDAEVLYYFKKAIEIDPNNAQAYDQLGRHYYSGGKYNQAEEMLLKALKLSPTMDSSKLSLAWIYLTAKPDPDKSVKYFREVLKNAKSGNVYFGLGLAYFADNQRQKAMEIITQLRTMKEEGLATQLEAALRENKRVVMDNILHSSETEDANSDDADSDVSYKTPTGTPAQDKPSVNVRLRGKLSDL